MWTRHKRTRQYLGEETIVVNSFCCCCCYYCRSYCYCCCCCCCCSNWRKKMSTWHLSLLSHTKYYYTQIVEALLKSKHVCLGGNLCWCSNIGSLITSVKKFCKFTSCNCAKTRFVCEYTLQIRCVKLCKSCVKLCTIWTTQPSCVVHIVHNFTQLYTTDLQCRIYLR